MIKSMTEEERKRYIERKKANRLNKCVCCGFPSKGDLCEFCLNEE